MNNSNYTPLKVHTLKWFDESLRMQAKLFIGNGTDIRKHKESVFIKSENKKTLVLLPKTD